MPSVGLGHDLKVIANSGLPFYPWLQSLTEGACHKGDYLKDFAGVV